MRVSVRTADLGASYTTRRLARRLVSPMCGLDQGVGFVLRDRLDPRFVVIGADLTGAYLLAGHDEPGSYHIGGCGVTVDEALIRALGETTERYAQVIAASLAGDDAIVASYREMLQGERRVLPSDRAHFEFFSREQHAQPGFPFDEFEEDAPLTWLRAWSALDEEEVWAPAQLMIVGYIPRRRAGEPWLSSAMSTGTAAHTSHDRALRNALLELIQIDAAMGHWYGSAGAPSIALTDRTRRIEKLIERQFMPDQPRPRFHWLPSADLPGLAVACLLEAPPGKIPAVGVGLGIDLRLEGAMYKALLEAVGVLQLAKVTLLNRAVREPDAADIDPRGILDLDTNVAYYAQPHAAPVLRSKFPDSDGLAASELPADEELDPADEVRLLLDGFTDAGLHLAWLDLTTADIRDLGFVVHRVWSPDTLSLSLPSAPPTLHPRFEAYGGAAYRDPHPYP